jgi:hypothetical protein
MSDRDIVIDQTSELEEILKENFTVQGSGLGEYVRSIEHLLPADLVQKLRFINTVRNKAAHERGFQLENEQKFITVCVEVKALLNAIAVEFTQHSEGVAATSANQPASFLIPEHLARFKFFYIPYLFQSLITLDCYTGVVLQVQERTETYKHQGKKTKALFQQIWLRLANNQEECLELYDFCVKTRKDHVITVFHAHRGNQSTYAAIYVHEIGRYFYNIYAWSSLLNRFLARLGQLIGGCLMALLLVNAIIWTLPLLFPGTLPPFVVPLIIGATIFLIFPYCAKFIGSVINMRFKRQFERHLAKLI